MARGAGTRVRAPGMIASLAIRLPNWLGDTVMAEPAVRALRRAYPEARVLLAGPWATVLGGQGLADTLVTYPRVWAGRLAAADVVRRFAPDTAVLLPNSLESALAAWYWGARRRVGFAAGGRSIALTDAVPLPASPRHQIDEYLMLAERCEAHADDTRPVLAPPPTDAAERVEARALLDAAGARRGRPAVGVHLGAAYGPAKTWPAERVVDVCRLLDDAGARAVLLGTADEAPTALAIAGQAPAATLAGRDRPALLSALLAELDALVAGDTGVAHARRHALRPHRSRTLGTARPSDLVDPRGAVRAVLLPRVSHRAPVSARPSRRPRARHGAGAARRGDAAPGHRRRRRGDAQPTRTARMSPRPLTVVHLATNRWWTGSADPTIQLAHVQQAHGYRVLLAVPPGDRFEAKAREAGLTLLDGVHLRARLAPLEIARDAARLRRVVREQSVDVLHAHHSHDHWLAVLARPAVDGRRPPVARTFHALRAVKRDPASRRLYRRTGAAFAVSRQIEARCREAGFAAERVYWTPGTVDLPRFTGKADGRAVREEFALGDAPVVVSVARLAPQRGHETLLAGFRGVLADFPAARLLLVGKGETRERLERFVAAQGLSRQVTFTGYRDRDLPDVLAAADCFALMAPGSDDSCRAALEAMAAARPVVARAVGALPETVAHGETGLLLEDDRPEAVASALRAMLADRTRAREMGVAGRRRVEIEFSPERALEIADRAYRAMLGARGQ